ncbi:MAG TPA: phospholipase D family protein [Allosphingosinicella sp.]|nr:phospholipase D family protein [Allosphingosinicella sp.]
MTDETAPSAGEFLFDVDLAERIREVAGGSDVRCAVAFWSEDGIDRIFASTKAARRARIVCDISMGSTSAEALETLGAPTRKALCHQRGLHAKVYISDHGLVTGSANASIAALGPNSGSARLTEAGTFHGPGSPAWKKAAAWFETVHGAANQVDQPALDWARRAYRPPRWAASRPPAPGSLLDAVRLDPERFAGAGFVFTSSASSDDEIKAAKRSAKRLGGTIAKPEIDAWPRGGFFTGWSAEQVTSWPTLFFEFWQPVQVLTMFAKTVRIHDPDNGSILSRNAWRTAAKLYGADLPTRTTIAKADAALAARIRGDGDGQLFIDAHALAKRLIEVKAGDAASAGSTAQ